MQVKYFKGLAVLILVIALVNTGMAQRKKQVRSGSAYGNSNSAYGNTNNAPADTTRKGNNNQSGYGNTGILVMVIPILVISQWLRQCCAGK